jgi:hypothetical protein
MSLFWRSCSVLSATIGNDSPRERRDVLVVDREVGRPESLDEPDQEAAEHRAGQRSDAPEHGGREGFDARHEAVGEAHDAVVHHPQEPGDGRERGAHDEGERDRAVDVDAEQRRHLAVLLAGPLRTAQRRLLHHVPEEEQQRRHRHHDDELLFCERHRACPDRQHENARQHRLERLVVGPLHDLHEVRQEDRHADRRDERR